MSEDIVYYNSMNQYCKNKFGDKVYKVSLDGGFTCPNRDGKIDTRGCIFCSAGGSGEFASDKRLSITKQIEEGICRVVNKMPDSSRKFIAYFQAYTNTYDDVKNLEQKYMEAINHPDIVALSIATRPDCLDDDAISLLSRLNSIKPVWVELGLQTIHDKSAKYIRRGYSLDVYDLAVSKLHRANIIVITHVIVGLPNETKDDVLKTIDYVGKISRPEDGIKIQLLHVLKGTDLEKDYDAGLFECLSLDEYCGIVHDAIRILPENMIVHRITGDGDKRLLVAPLWSANKKMVINEMRKYVLPRQ